MPLSPDISVRGFRDFFAGDKSVFNLIIIVPFHICSTQTKYEITIDK